VKDSFLNLLFWLVVAAAVVLLAPYAGVHILSSPPIPDELRDPVTTSLPPLPDSFESDEMQRATDSSEQQGDNLDEIHGLLAE
jgi:hypothetical protein